jgi:SPP1 family predicted phage head-tail adaptor
MRAGSLRHQVVLEASAEARGTDGEVTLSWVTVATVWASIEPTKGKEYISEDIIKAAATHLVTIRYLPVLDPSMRVTFGARVFGIQSIIDKHERRRELVLVCVEEL